MLEVLNLEIITFVLPTWANKSCVMYVTQLSTIDSYFRYHTVLNKHVMQLSPPPNFDSSVAL